MTSSSETDDYWDPHYNDLTNGGVTVAECDSKEECYFAAYLLQEGGIKSAVLIPNVRLDLRLPQVRVAPDDEALAREILARPITQEKRAEYFAEPDEDEFIAPQCPECGSPDVLLESVVDSNVWKCGICCASWTEHLQTGKN